MAKAIPDSSNPPGFILNQRAIDSLRTYKARSRAPSTGPRLPINTTISLTGPLRLHPPTIRLPARPLCPSSFASTGAFLFVAL
jgi:hypothetical protein